MGGFAKLLLIAYATFGAPMLIVVIPSTLAFLWTRKRKILDRGVLFRYRLVAFVLAALVILTLAYVRYEDNAELSRNVVTIGWWYMTSPDKDYTLAMRYNQLGFELGHAEGAANIGLLYENGWGVGRDLFAAATWYLKAIDMGDFRSAQADYHLAVLYENGIGVPKDIAKAKMHYAEALRIATGTDHETYYDEVMVRLAGEGLKKLP